MSPLRIVFQGTISWALPPMNEGRKNCLSSGFHLMYISNHWSNLETTQKFIEHIHALSKNLSGEICFTG
jgi:hypothetical protein